MMHCHILEFPADWVLPQDARFFQTSVLDAGRLRKVYEIEMKLVNTSTPRETEYKSLFQRIKPYWQAQFGWPADWQKGLVRLVG